MTVLPYRPVAIFLRQNYLARTLTGAERLRCHLHNYAFLCARFSPFSLTDLFSLGCTLFTRSEDGVAASCVLSVEQKAAAQGEMSLSLRLGPAEVYVLGFVFAPGELFAAPGADTVLLISRMQGMAASFEDIRAATKLFGDIAPQATLFAALVGIADRLGLRYICGVPARLHPSRTGENADLLHRNYDAFFASAGATPAEGGVYVYDRTRFTDILDHMPAKHRARTKAKRRLKASLATDVVAALAPCVLPDEPPARTWHFLSSHLSTRVGERRDNAIAAVGTAGCLLFGPYAYLEAGRYEVDFALEGEPAAFVVEATAGDGQEILARERFKDWRRGQPVRLGFTLDAARDDLEFRLFVGADAVISVRGVSVSARA